jgi:glycerol uptake facilitator-like aquaporin
MVYATYNISGAQLNPAVTFALTLLGKKCRGISSWVLEGLHAMWIYYKNRTWVIC